MPAEIARWYAAAAAEAELDADDQRAVQRLGQALRWRPDDPDLLVRRAELRLRLNDRTGSLDDSERALQLTVGGQQVEALEQRIAVFQRMGNHRAALQDADRLLELVAAAPNRELQLSHGRILAYPGALNNRAYACALAERNIEQGLEDIQLAFDLIGSEEDSALLDTRGYLMFLAGDLDRALTDMERAVRMAEAERLAFQRLRSAQRNRGIDPRLLDRHSQLLDQSRAVLYHHRGLVYQQLGRETEAERDLTLAQELGYDPERGIW